MKDDDVATSRIHKGGWARVFDRPLDAKVRWSTGLPLACNVVPSHAAPKQPLTHNARTHGPPRPATLTTRTSSSNQTHKDSENMQDVGSAGAISSSQQ